MTSELMRATVAEPQGDAREGGAERSGRQTRDHRNTNRQRGRQWAISVLADAKSNPHQDTACRAGWPEGKVKDLTRGDLLRASAGGVSRGRSSVESRRKAEGAKDRRNQQQRSTEHCVTGQNTPGSSADRSRPAGSARVRCAQAMQSRQAERRVEFPETRMNRERTAMLEAWWAYHQASRG